MKDVRLTASTILRVFYFCLFFSVGAFQFLNLYYGQIGFSQREIGILFAVGPFMMLVGQPFWGYVSDRWDAPKWVLGILLSGSALTALGFLLTDRFSLYLVLNVFYWFFQSAINPIIDSTALKLLPDKNQYGSIRMWGALGYALSVVIVGWLLDVVGLFSLFIIHACLLIFTLAIGLQLPIKRGNEIKFDWKEATQLFKSKPYVAFLVFNFLLQLTVSINNSFYGLYLKELGVGVTMVGVALLIKSILEVPFFGLSNRLITRFSFRFLFALGAFVYALRWLILGISTATSLLIISQVLLSLSFSLLSFTSVLFVDRIMPDHYKSTGQTLYWATSMGISGVVGNVLAAWFLNNYSMGEMYRWITAMALLAGLIIWFSLGREESKAHRKKTTKEMKM
ncbi:MFS family permease [Pullulanibacillus pueri]|uniref:Putative transporter YwbF n=1 Tax=Pullulanibacillus pueri TaxID=1437324 RepID=A0A8J2ZYR0_9BACL|nr:MFS transporter [Pullulanibacillus pueri]MBM7683666.1 MFS family permease [Pullulanibacillus pueri]GGH87174.1 putative transporter YwbF [Pullulanibacillus pueri]